MINAQRFVREKCISCGKQKTYFSHTYKDFDEAGKIKHDNGITTIKVIAYDIPTKYYFNACSLQFIPELIEVDVSKEFKYLIKDSNIKDEKCNFHELSENLSNEGYISMPMMKDIGVKFGCNLDKINHWQYGDSHLIFGDIDIAELVENYVPENECLKYKENKITD